MENIVCFDGLSVALQRKVLKEMRQGKFYLERVQDMIRERIIEIAPCPGSLLEISFTKPFFVNGIPEYTVDKLKVNSGSGDVRLALQREVEKLIPEINELLPKWIKELYSDEVITDYFYEFDTAFLESTGRIYG